MQLLENSVNRKRIYCILLIIIFFGVILRIYGISKESLWNDELSSWVMSNYETFSEVVKEGAYPDVHPPGYHILLYFIEKYVGDSEAVLRTPSAIAGSISIVLIFLVGIKLYTFEEGLIASAFMAFSWCPIFYSQEARSNSLLLMFTLLSMYFWITLLDQLNSDKGKCQYSTILGYVLSAIISCYLHYFGLFFIALQGIVAVIFMLKKKKKMITTFLIYFSIVLAYVPWLKPFWMDLQRRSIWIPPPKITAFLGYLKFCFNDSKIILLLILPLLLFFFLNEVKKIRDGNEWKPSLSLSNPTFLVLLWVCVPFSIAFFKSILSTPVLIYRNLIISLPAVYLLFARSVKVLPLKPINRFGIIFGIIVLLLTHNLFVNKYYTRPHKEQFREATDYIIEHDSNFGQASIIVGHSTRGKRYDYYFNKRNYPKRPEIIAGLKQDIPRLSQMISMRNPQYIWYISVHRLPDKEFLDYLNRQFQLLEVKSFIKGKVWLFKNRSEKSSERKINMNS